MRNATNIRIFNDEIILHILDPKLEHNGTAISTQPIHLEGNEALRTFICAHIQNGLKDSGSKAAKFRIVNRRLPSGICAEMINLHLPLVPGSQELAGILDNVMNQNHQISSGDLIVCLFEAENMQGRSLALIKLDPSDAYLQESFRDADGNIFNNIHLEPNALPSTQERLQKCAFIRTMDPRNQDYDMLLLDRQSSADEGRRIAKFFIKDFLEAEYALDTNQRTLKLYQALISAQTQIQKALSPEEIEDFNTRIREVVTSASVNLDDWVDRLPMGEDHKNTINQVLLELMPDREFDLDREFGRKISNKRRFKAEHNFRLSIDSEGYERIVKLSTWFDDNVTHTKKHRLVIETDQWDEMAKP